MFTQNTNEAPKHKPPVIQLKVALQEVEEAMTNVDRACADMMKAHRELSIRRDNLRALIREQE